MGAARNRRRRQSANADVMVDAKILALKLADVCSRDDVEPFTVIMALSVLLGATIGSVAKGDKVVDLAIATMRRAIATRNDDDHAGLQ
jgi:hypothetical protein